MSACLPGTLGPIQALGEGAQDKASTMTSYRDPSFQDRAGRAADAKRKALDQLRARPAVDPSVLADRQAAQQARQAGEAERRSAKQAAKAQADAEKAERRAQPEPEAPAAPTEAELKAKRDARYAARAARR